MFADNRSLPAKQSIKKWRIRMNPVHDPEKHKPEWTHSQMDIKLYSFGIASIWNCAHSGLCPCLLESCLSGKLSEQQEEDAQNF